MRRTVDPARCPWLMFCHREKTRCCFLDPLKPSVIHGYDMPELRGARISSSKDGWLLLSKGHRSMFFFNPFSKVTVELPDLEDNVAFNFVYFTMPPTSSNCTIFGISNECNHLIIYLLHLGEEAWTSRKWGNNNLIVSSGVSPIFYDGEFYILGYDGDLGVLDPMEDTVNMNFIDTPCPGVFDIVQNYLVERNGEILAIFVGYKGKWLSVYKLDRHDMSWTIQDSLEDQMLFLSRSESLLLPAKSEAMQNNIYFPLWFNNNNNYVFYSMDTKYWHTSSGDCLYEDISGVKEQLHCTWIQPCLAREIKS